MATALISRRQGLILAITAALANICITKTTALRKGEAAPNNRQTTIVNLIDNARPAVIGTP